MRLRAAGALKEIILLCGVGRRRPKGCVATPLDTGHQRAAGPLRRKIATTRSYAAKLLPRSRRGATLAARLAVCFNGSKLIKMLRADGAPRRSRQIFKRGLARVVARQEQV